jgi:glutamate synthase (ferredoxin)
MDAKELLPLCSPALDNGAKVSARLAIRNTDRTTCTVLGHEITKRYGAAGLPEDTISLVFSGSAGQSFCAFAPKGITAVLEGDANDYLGKGLSGAKLIVKPPVESRFIPEDNIIIGNVSLYGATSGEAYIYGAAGERFCVRNSGAHAVVESVGDHGCEYMTGGTVVILGKTGRNFAAGMSGGVAYVYDGDGSFPISCNTEMVELIPVEEDDGQLLFDMVKKHFEYTGSRKAKSLLNNWKTSLSLFVKVMPKDYKRMLHAIKKAYSEGYTGDEAIMSAFESTNRDLAGTGGN